MSASTPSPTLTLKDIAREAGVSLATVDRVLHERPGVRPVTVKRVKDTIERHEFRPFAAAADLARGGTNRFAVVMNAGSNLFMQQILSHLRDLNGWLSARRIAVEVITTDVFNPEVLARTLDSVHGRLTASRSWRLTTRVFGRRSTI